MRKLLTIVGALLICFAAFAVYLTRDGELVTPQGDGKVELASGIYEAFGLPEYVKPHITDDYKSYFIEVEPGIKIHVLEVGEGTPVYMQHGNPTSGLLYRKVAAALPKDQFRMIMPTMVGLGFSSKVPASQHTVENHTRWMGAVLRQLDLKQVIYVGQDWGGPVGVGALATVPGLVQGMVLMNTGVNAPKEAMDLSRAHAVVKTPVVGELATSVLTNMFDGLPQVQGDPDSMPADVLALYANPVFDSGNSKAPLALMRMVPDGPDHRSAKAMQRIESYALGLDIPVELVWGTKDPILGNALPVMQENFPNAPSTKTDAGHFLQEEVPGVIAGAIMRIADQLAAE